MSATCETTTYPAKVPSPPEARCAAPHVTPTNYFQWKPYLDRVLACLLLIPGLPLIGLLMLLVRATSRGPGIFRQVRVGKGGRRFTMYKIRTMRQDAEAKSGPVWSQKKDARVTLLGRVFRKLHLDELPQLFNVLRGEMSLIGPRPERPEFVELLARKVPGYLDRLAVPPGITGLAQINLPPDSDLNSVRRKLALDRDYIETASLFLDLRMFLCTGVRLVGLPGVIVMYLFGLHREAPEFEDATDAAIMPDQVDATVSPASRLRHESIADNGDEESAAVRKPSPRRRKRRAQAASKPR